MSRPSIRRYSSIFKVKKHITFYFNPGYEVICVEFPFDVNGEMMYVFTAYAEELPFQIGFPSIVLRNEQIDEYLEYSREREEPTGYTEKEDTNAN